MLELIDIHTSYGITQVLHGVSIKVPDHSVVALLGRNGMGRTTTLRTIVGLTPARQGEIWFKGENITKFSSHQISRKGIGLVPQGRQIFPSLSVSENLTMAARTSGKSAKDVWSLDKIYSLFPILKERSHLKGTLLSGGEQQILAICRTLMTNPDLLLMDEPSEGLAPILVQEISRIIAEIKGYGFSILLVEQNLNMALTLADYVYIMSKGIIVYQGFPQELAKNDSVQNNYLGVSHD